MTSSGNDPQAYNQAFVERLANLCRDRGHRAALRRWWSSSTRHHAYPVLGNLGVLDDPRFTFIAALYAAHGSEHFSAHKPGGPGVGRAALRLAGGKTSSPAFESMERHFRRLLACDTIEELGPQLHRIIKRLQRESVPLDYVALIKDLRLWADYSEQVKIRWATDFWQATEPEESATPAKA